MRTRKQSGRVPQRAAAAEIGRMTRRHGRRVVRICALAGALIAAAPVGAQAPAEAPRRAPEVGTLRVLLYDATPCLPIAGVPLVLTEAGASATTDSLGVAVFETIPAGAYTLEITVRGRESRSKRIVIDPAEMVQLAIDVSRPEP